MIASYHNHTTWSDGVAPIAAVVARAGELGVHEVGVSDHLTLRPDGSVPHWSMRPDRLAAYVEEVRAAGDSGAGPTVRLGLEVDWFPGHGAAISEALEGVSFDFLIGSVHEVGGFVVDVASADWERLLPEEREEVHRGYWAGLADLADSRLFDVVGHLDLPKKFRQAPRSDLSGVVSTALDAIRDAGLVVELNTAGWHTPGRDAFPSLELLQACRRRDIPVTLSADAHHPDHLCRDFDRGLERLHAAGYREVVRFAGRERWFDPVDRVATELPCPSPATRSSR